MIDSSEPLISSSDKTSGKIRGSGIGGISLMSWGEKVDLTLTQTSTPGEFSVKISCYGIIPLQLWPRDYSRNIITNIELNSEA